MGEEDCGMMGGNCGQRLFSTRPNRVSYAVWPVPSVRELVDSGVYKFEVRPDGCHQALQV